MRQMHAEELEDLRQKSFLDVGLDSSQFFKYELANAIREIRNENRSLKLSKSLNKKKYKIINI